MTIDESEKIKTAVENKDYIVQLVNEVAKEVAKTMIEAFENLKIEDVNMFQLGYNKAIDDLLEDANEMAIEVDTGTYTMKAIGIGLLEKIAEKLKEGGKNE